MKCPKCQKEGYRFIEKKAYNKPSDKWIRKSYKKACFKCGFEED